MTNRNAYVGGLARTINIVISLTHPAFKNATIDGQESTMDEPLLLTPERAADRLDIGRTRMYELIASGEIESVKIARSRRIPVDALHAYVARLRTAGTAKAA